MINIAKNYWTIEKCIERRKILAKIIEKIIEKR